MLSKFWMVRSKSSPLIIWSTWSDTTYTHTNIKLIVISLSQSVHSLLKPFTVQKRRSKGRHLDFIRRAKYNPWVIFFSSPQRSDFSRHIKYWRPPHELGDRTRESHGKIRDCEDSSWTGKQSETNSKMWILTLNRKHDLVVELSEVWDRSLSGRQTDELRTYEFSRYLDKSLSKVSWSRTWPV